MGESEFHYQVQAGLRDYLKDGVAGLLGATENPILRERIRSFRERGTFLIEYEDKLCKQADVSFGHAGTLPSLVKPQVVLVYPRLRAIVRRARHLHDPIQFSMEIGDEEEHPSETRARYIAEAERRVTEAHNEAERRVAEARNEARIEMDRWMVEMERRLDAELEQRVAGRRLEAE
ncbi:hypothetical protein N0V88_007684 [Collariella sp. IMI 366227]|nr:hypothetical protein N0V88_007684 [Collariella sp. IMI 366227]